MSANQAYSHCFEFRKSSKDVKSQAYSYCFLFRIMKITGWTLGFSFLKWIFLIQKVSNLFEIHLKSRISTFFIYLFYSIMKHFIPSFVCSDPGAWLWKSKQGSLKFESKTVWISLIFWPLKTSITYYVKVHKIFYLCFSLQSFGTTVSICDQLRVSSRH